MRRRLIASTRQPRRSFSGGGAAAFAFTFSLLLPPGLGATADTAGIALGP